MSLSNFEQETVINYNRAEEQARIYTADPVLMRKLRQYIEENPQDFKIVDSGYIKGENVSITVECPKQLIKIQKKRITRNLTDEQRAALADRLKKNIGGKNNNET